MQLFALKYCVKMCKRWEGGAAPGSAEAINARDIAAKHTKSSQLLATKHTLQEFGFTQPEFMSLSKDLVCTR